MEQYNQISQKSLKAHISALSNFPIFSLHYFHLLQWFIFTSLPGDSSLVKLCQPLSARKRGIVPINQKISSRKTGHCKHTIHKHCHLHPSFPQSWCISVTPSVLCNIRSNSSPQYNQIFSENNHKSTSWFRDVEVLYPSCLTQALFISALHHSDTFPPVLMSCRHFSLSHH